MDEEEKTQPEQFSPRSLRIAMAGHMIEDAIALLDACQSGDWRGQISPVKHALRDATWPLLEQVFKIAQQAYIDEQEKK